MIRMGQYARVFVPWRLFLRCLCLNVSELGQEPNLEAWVSLVLAVGQSGSWLKGSWSTYYY